MIKLIRKKGRGCMLMKKDFCKFYRQIYMDPGCIHLLGFSFENKIYFDIVLSMGLRIACFIAQRISNAVMWIYKRLSYEGLNYIDDLGAVEVAKKSREAYLKLGELISNLHMWESPSKSCPPNTVMVFLGIRYDTIKFTIEITADRLAELKQLFVDWLSKDSITLTEVQSLLGKLNFICQTVRAGRVFICRIINVLKEMHPTEPIPTPLELKQDIWWWHNYMDIFNGICMMPEVKWHATDAKMSSDSCLSGCGGWSTGEYFHTIFPASIMNLNLTINELECLAVVICLKVWGSKYAGKNLLLHCDNSSTVNVINRGAASNRFTQKCLREVAWLCAMHNLWIKMKFLP